MSALPKPVGPFRVPYENVFVDKNETKFVIVFGIVYKLSEIKDGNGYRFLSVVRQGDDQPIPTQEREFVLERFALSLIAPKEVG